MLPAVQPGQTVEKRGFTDTGVTDNGHKFPRSYLATDVLKDVHGLMVPSLLALGEVLYLQQW